MKNWKRAFRDSPCRELGSLFRALGLFKRWANYRPSGCPRTKQRSTSRTNMFGTYTVQQRNSRSCAFVRCSPVLESMFAAYAGPLLLSSIIHLSYDTGGIENVHELFWITLRYCVIRVVLHLACLSTTFRPLETLARTTLPELIFRFKCIGAPGLHGWGQTTSAPNGLPCLQMVRTRLVTNMDTEGGESAPLQ